MEGPSPVMSTVPEIDWSAKVYDVDDTIFFPKKSPETYRRIMETILSQKVDRLDLKIRTASTR